MSLTTPSKIRELQIKLCRKAKNEPGYRFYMLYDKVYREDVLAHAHALARANRDAPARRSPSFARMDKPEAYPTGSGKLWTPGAGGLLRLGMYRRVCVLLTALALPLGGADDGALGRATLRGWNSG